MLCYCTCVLLVAQEIRLGAAIEREGKGIEEGKGNEKEKDLQTWGYCRSVSVVTIEKNGKQIYIYIYYDP